MVEVMYGPMQLLVVGFSDPDFHGQTRRALGSVMEKGIVRLIDLQFVYKDADGNVSTIEATQLDEDERIRFGAAIGALIGLGAGAAAGAPFLPKLAQVAKGDIAFAMGLMVVTIAYMPIVLPLLLSGVTIDPREIAQSLILLMLYRSRSPS